MPTCSPSGGLNNVGEHADVARVTIRFEQEALR